MGGAADVRPRRLAKPEPGRLGMTVKAAVFTTLGAVVAWALSGLGFPAVCVAWGAGQLIGTGIAAALAAADAADAGGQGLLFVLYAGVCATVLGAVGAGLREAPTLAVAAFAMGISGLASYRVLHSRRHPLG